eukprot:Platyproteum_vivax@DN6392_c0_g2_i1.p1
MELEVPKNKEEKVKGSRVIVVLEEAALETVKVKDSFQLLNADDHKGILARDKRTINLYRPDITHQCLMTLLDSPLNKAGRLLIYIHTANNVLIEVSPQLRVPRTFKRFAGLMVEVLHKHKVRAVDSKTCLLKVIANPVSKYLPSGGARYGFSVNGRLVNLRKFVENLELPPVDTDPCVPLTFVIGATAHTDPTQELDYVEENIGISHYGLSASVCCGKLCNEFEYLWDVL